MGWWAALFHGILNSNAAQKGRTLPVKGRKGGAVLSARLRWSKQTGPANIQDAAAAHLVDSVWLKMMNHHSAAPECDQTRSAACENRNQQVHGVTPSRWKHKSKDTYTNNSGLIVRQWYTWARTTNIRAELTPECSIYISAEQLCQLQDYRQAIDFQAQGQYLYTRLQAVNSAVLHHKWQIFDQSTKKKEHQLRFHGC